MAEDTLSFSNAGPEALELEESLAISSELGKRPLMECVLPGGRY